MVVMSSVYWREKLNSLGGIPILDYIFHYNLQFEVSLNSIVLPLKRIESIEDRFDFVDQFPSLFPTIFRRLTYLSIYSRTQTSLTNTRFVKVYSRTTSSDLSTLINFVGYGVLFLHPMNYRRGEGICNGSRTYERYSSAAC